MRLPATVTTADGATVALHDLGGRGPNLLLAHATGHHGLVWRPLAAALAEGARAVAFDARGHGDSSLPPEWDFGWTGLARDALAVAERLGAAPLWGFGHSSGATALLLAEQARPGTFAGLYCYEPAIAAADPPLGRDPDSWLAAAARRRRETFASRQAAEARFAAGGLATWAPEALDGYLEHGLADAGTGDGPVRLKCPPEREARIDEMATAHDCFGRLGQVGCAVFLAGGRNSDALSPGQLEALARRMPRARTEVLGGLGHMGPLEDPARVAASVLTFLAAHQDRAGAMGKRGEPL